MATVYKAFLNDDVVSTRSLLHEAIPVTGSLIYGSYNEKNIKNYSHGRFQSVYDYPWLSSSANHVMDITVGYSYDSGLYTTGNSTEQSQKNQMYNQMAQNLVGYNTDGTVLKFDSDGDFISTITDKMSECVFLSFSRLLVKDEIKKGSVQLQVGAGTNADPFSVLKTIRDFDANVEYRTNSPAGEFGILFSGNSYGDEPCGLVYYQAGVMVVTASVFGATDFTETQALDPALVETRIQDICNEVRHRIYDIDFNNTIELNSTIYFCRVNHNEFNYSSNPSYLNSSQIRVKDQSLDSPTSYITTVGLYSSTNELLAVAKLSEPLKKTPENELVLRVRLDY